MTKYLHVDSLLNINTIHFKQIVRRICLAEFQITKANSSDTEATLFDLDAWFYNGMAAATKDIYTLRDRAI